MKNNIIFLLGLFLIFFFSKASHTQELNDSPEYYDCGMYVTQYSRIIINDDGTEEPEYDKYELSKIENPPLALTWKRFTANVLSSLSDIEPRTTDIEFEVLVWIDGSICNVNWQDVFGNSREEDMYYVKAVYNKIRLLAIYKSNT